MQQLVSALNFDEFYYYECSLVYAGAFSTCSTI